jgi:hypothetical protein
MSETVSQFVARVLDLQITDIPDKYGDSPRCWLCGGDTNGKGLMQHVHIGMTFTQHNTAKCSDSDCLCNACACVIDSVTFKKMVTDRQLPIKIWSQAGWHSYSHYIHDSGIYKSPNRKEMRDIILNPPSGRWVLTVNSSGKKHTVFRASVASSTKTFPVQLDETTVWCDADLITACIADFEALSALGFSKDSILSGDYHPAQMLKVGIKRFMPCELKAKEWRDKHPDYMMLAHVVAFGQSEFEEVVPVEYVKTETAKPAPVTQKQMELFL